MGVCPKLLRAHKAHVYRGGILVWSMALSLLSDAGLLFLNQTFVSIKEKKIN